MTFIAKQQSSPGSALLEFLSSLSWSNLPPETRAKAVQALLDNIACGLYGSQYPWGKITADFVLDEGSKGGATVFGRHASAAPARAALCNGTMIHGFELDDVILGSQAHPGTVVAPSALAVAEDRGASPDRLLLGIVAGYEVMGRLGAALGAPYTIRGFHNTGVAGVVASAVAASITAGFSLEQMTRAVGIACSSASGIKAFTQGNGGMTKRFHGGHAAECGVTAALLAERGFTGPMQALDGRFGLLEVIGGEGSDAAILSKNLGDDLAVNRAWTKIYSCCGLIHTTVQALETIRRRENLSPDAIKQVRIGAIPRSIQQNNDPAPKETMLAQYSFPFCAAITLTGDIKNLSAFAPENLSDPVVMAMIQRISLYPDDDILAAYPGKFGSKVEVETTDGRRFNMTLWDAHGMPLDPCDDAEMTDKFRRLCSSVAAQDKVENLRAAIMRLRDGGSLQELSEALQCIGK